MITLHRCHAIGCETSVPPRRFMCVRHWGMLPAAMQRRIWSTYRPGQEEDKRPSQAYLVAAHASAHWLHEREGKPGTLCVVCIQAKAATA